MKIGEIDKALAPQESGSRGGGKRFYTLPCAPFDIYGVSYFEEEKRFSRMPERAAAAVSEGVHALSSHVSGGRIRFSARAKEIYIKAEWAQLAPFPHMPLSGVCGFTLLKETDKGCTFVKNFFPEVTESDGMERSAPLPEGFNDYILWLPLYNGLKSLEIGFDEGAEVSGGRKYSYTLPVLFYGSSITQGGCASRPDNCYAAYLSKWLNTDFINLGFSGSAKGEPAMTEYLSRIPCAAFVCDYDHNAPSAQHLENTLYPLYETFRAAQPKTPFFFVSKPDYDSDQKINERRRKVVKDAYKKALAAGDKNVYFTDGKKLFGSKDRENCFVDGCHPNDLGFYRMAKMLYKPLKEAIKDYKI